MQSQSEEILKPLIRTAAGNGASPTFAVDNDAIVAAIRRLNCADNIQKADDGRRPDGFSPELLTGLTMFANRMCPFCDRW